MEYCILFFILNAFQSALANDLIRVELGSVLCFFFHSLQGHALLKGLFDSRSQSPIFLHIVASIPSPPGDAESLQYFLSGSCSLALFPSEAFSDGTGLRCSGCRA